jgi:hypothetical protein
MQRNSLLFINLMGVSSIMMKGSVLQTLGTLLFNIRSNSAKKKAEATVKKEASEAAAKLRLRTIDLSRARFITTAKSKIPVLVVKRRKPEMQLASA